jgi:hypothetical protein
MPGSADVSLDLAAQDAEKRQEERARPPLRFTRLFSQPLAPSGYFLSALGGGSQLSRCRKGPAARARLASAESLDRRGQEPLDKE